MATTFTKARQLQFEKIPLSEYRQRGGVIGKGHYYREYFNFYAVCDTCGEAHYLNKNNQMQVNGSVVRGCIVCEPEKIPAWVL